MTSIIEGDDCTLERSMSMPRNSCCHVVCIHFAKITDRFSSSNLEKADFNVAKLSSHVYDEVKMSSIQLAKFAWDVPRARMTILVNAAGSIIKPNSALLHSHERPSGSQKVILHLSFSAIGAWLKPVVRSNYVK